jgi:hypothetical protein
MPLSIKLYATIHFSMSLHIVVHATIHFGICHFTLWYMPLSISACVTLHCGTCHYLFWHMSLYIVVYATIHFGIYHFTLWYMPLSISAYVTLYCGICHYPFWHIYVICLKYAYHMSMICKDIIGQHTLSLQRSRCCPSLCSRISRSWATLSRTSWVSRNGNKTSGSDNCCLGHQQLVHCVVGHILLLLTIHPHLCRENPEIHGSADTFGH